MESNDSTQKGYRPPKWNNPYTDTKKEVGERGYLTSYHRAYESGADAMLEEVEALKKRVAELEAALQSDASDLWKVTNAIREEMDTFSWIINSSKEKELEELFTRIKNHIELAQHPAQKRFYELLKDNPFIAVHKADIKNMWNAIDDFFEFNMPMLAEQLKNSKGYQALKKEWLEK